MLSFSSTMTVKMIAMMMMMMMMMMFLLFLLLFDVVATHVFGYHRWLVALLGKSLLSLLVAFVPVRPAVCLLSLWTKSEQKQGV